MDIGRSRDFGSQIMDLTQFLEENRSSIIKRWFNKVVDTYPTDTTTFLRQQQDRFANPVGASFKDGLSDMVDGMIKGWELDKFQPALDRIIRIRALQRFSPSSAIAFIGQLKDVLGGLTAKAKLDAEATDNLEKLNQLIDHLQFMAFDTYVASRDRIWEIRFKDEQRRVYTLLRRANMICDNPFPGVELPDFRNGGH